MKRQGVSARREGSRFAFFTLMFSASLSLLGQNTGSISGVVNDQQSAAIASAKVQLLNEAQGGVITGEVTTSSSGAFSFNGLFPAQYTISIEAAGFRKFAQKNIKLNVGDNLGLPPIVLEIGATTESVTVEGTAAQLETVTAARSGVVSATSIVDLATSGRGFTDLIKTIPGVASDTSTNVNGQRADQINYAVDGVTVIDSGCNCLGGNRVNIDTIAEFKVTSNGQTAEFGRSSGATIAVVTKSGTSEFHGNAYGFRRAEFMNANSFNNNYNGVPIVRARNLTAGFTFGGPAYIPGKFNTNKDKLFFFMANEWNRQLNLTVQTLRLPTVNERNGIFTGSLDTAGRPVTILDPTTKTPFPNNVVPAARFVNNAANPWGQKILNFFNVPNGVNSGNNTNDRREYDASGPRYDQTYRVDYNFTQNQRAFVRIIRNITDAKAPCGALNSNQNTCLADNLVRRTGNWGITFSLVSIIGPRTTNEALFGNSRNYLPVPAPPTDSKYYQSVSGLSIPSLYPKADPGKFTPNFIFQGLAANLNQPCQGAIYPCTALQGLPYQNLNPVINFNDNLTHVLASHTLKFGVYYESTLKEQTTNQFNNGLFDFTTDANNPGNANFVFANALLGNFTTYRQANTISDNRYRYRNLEWYGQDTWKVRSNLTVTLGLRMSLMPPQYEENNRVANFDPSLFSKSKQVVLYRPACVGTTCGAQNPLAPSGALLPTTLVGRIVPGSGDINNGMAVAGANGYPKGLINSRGVQWGPRIGLAWTPGGAGGKTVIRMGAGAFYERIFGNVIFFTASNPPLNREAQVFYGQVGNVAGDGALTDSPVDVRGFDRDGKLPTTYNYNFGVQRQLPGRMILDVSYVGSISRHLTTLVPFNVPDLGSAWLPQNQDPSKGAAKFDGTTTLPVNFYRPYVGYIGAGSNNGGGTIFSFGGSSNYNSLQVSLNKSLSHGLQGGVNYTWSKALGISSSSQSEPVNPFNAKAANYGPLTFDRRHNLTVSFLYNIPDASRRAKVLNNFAGRLALAGWELSGVTAFTTGAPGVITYSYSTAAGNILNNASGATLGRLITGSEEIVPRPVLTCNPMADSTSLLQWLKPSCVQPARKGSNGYDSGNNSVYGPGLSNFDTSLFKNIYFSQDSRARYLQLRLETYNTFNHTQGSGIQRNVTFDPVTGNITNMPGAAGVGRFNGFGTVNAFRANRTMQLALKLYF